MKKIALLSIVLFIPVFCAFSAQSSYLMPYNATNGIPMDSPYYWKVTKGWDRFMHGDDTQKGHYTGYMQVAHGGIRDIPFHEGSVDGQGNAKHDIIIDLKISSPSGLNFVSLGNPHITRPFELYIVLKHSSIAVTRPAFSNTYEPESAGNYLEPFEGTATNFRIVKLDKSGQEISVSFPFRPLKSREDREQQAGVLPGFGRPAYTKFHEKGRQKIWFDVCIVLPGELPAAGAKSLADGNDRIRMSDGKMKQLVIADDYSASVILDMHIYCPAYPDVDVTQSISIPMRGFYDGSKVPNPATEGMIQVSILPTAACNNLDLMKQQGQYVKIADLNVNTTRIVEHVNGKDVIKEAARPAYVFLSSSSDPYKPGSEFVLKHREAPEFGEYNTRNHMKYTVMLYEYGKTGHYQYDGTMAIARGTAPDVGQPATANLNKLARTHERSEPYADEPYVYYALDSELGIIMENKNGLAMIRGAYDSKIYIHVVTDDGFAAGPTT